MALSIFMLILILGSTISARKDLDRLINGEAAQFMQFPHQVYYLKYITKTGWVHPCGGSIISKRIILTAAHCVSDKFKYLLIFLGKTNLDNEYEKGQQCFLLGRSRVIIHEEFDGHTLLNDIALIKMRYDIKFSEFIQPASLPMEELDYVNQTAVVSGWGSIIHDYNPKLHVGTKQLHHLNVTIISNEVCKKLVQEMVPAKPFTEAFICHRPTNGSPCNGDSGGPLILLDGSRTLVGITSHGVRGCDRYSPGIYTRISSYLGWIAKYENDTNFKR
ncbi:chymotrypsin-like [Scaptodrosophila lebanonensis]|uniref:Chymotrypsin-like n=1 Tax=Drosophila lebanonensis TaxID=7225 RepID=A0A6J2UFR9_DROLE|nr:chymotrypsin-like [Scaptodrosophila lebanonensis]